MKVVVAGHEYILDTRLGNTASFQFYQDPDIHGTEIDGPLNQEVLRMLINRVQTLHQERPWDRNQEIIQHLRSSIMLHEVRAIERMVEKDEAIELIKPNNRGHLWRVRS
jgi:hypothetical protein